MSTQNLPSSDGGTQGYGLEFQSWGSSYELLCCRMPTGAVSYRFVVPECAEGCEAGWVIFLICGRCNTQKCCLCQEQHKHRKKKSKYKNRRERLLFSIYFPRLALVLTFWLDSVGRNGEEHSSCCFCHTPTHRLKKEQLLPAIQPTVLFSLGTSSPLNKITIIYVGGANGVSAKNCRFNGRCMFACMYTQKRLSESCQDDTTAKTHIADTFTTPGAHKIATISHQTGRKGTHNHTRAFGTSEFSQLG